MLQALLASVASSYQINLTVPDIYWDSVSFISGFEGTNLASVFVDESDVPATVTVVGSPFTSTTESRHGSTSMSVNENNSSDEYIHIGDPVTSGCDFGLGDFTVEGWFNNAFSHSTWYHSAVGNFVNTDDGSWSVFMSDDPNNYIVFVVDGQAVGLQGTTTVNSGWHHFAVSRNGATLRLFVDGVMEAKVTDWGAVDIAGTGNVVIGGNNAGAQDRWRGWLDEMRITKGVGRYDSDSDIVGYDAPLPRVGPASFVSTHTVTIPSGTVNSDLIGFPLMVDMSDMPSSFWAGVNEDGGNIRAYADDGTTALPIDVTYTNKDLRTGRMFLKTDITTATDTVIRISLLDSGASAPLEGDTFGRNAVWGDYETVLVFPSTVDRTGNATTVDLTGMEDHSVWIRTDYYGSLTGDPHQGIATDGAGTFVTIDTNYLRKYTGGIAGSVVASNADPVADVITATGNVNLNHLSDGCIFGGELWVPCNEYPVSGGNDEFLVVFNLSDLTVNRFYDVSATGRHVSGICYNPDNSTIYATDYLDGTSLMTFSTSGVNGADVTLSTPVSLLQGIEYVDGVLMLNSSDEILRSFELDGTYIGQALEDPHTGIGEGLCFDGTSLYILEGDGDLPVFTRDVHQDYIKAHYGTGTVTIPYSDVWTSATSVYWTDTSGDTQQQFLDALDGNGVNGTGLLYDDGPDVLGMWNATDGWLHSTVNPTYKDDFRISFAHDGTAERKLFVDGAVWKDTTVTQRPSSGTADMMFNLGSASGESYLQTMWVRAEYMSDDWMEADALNTDTSTAFYTIVGSPDISNVLYVNNTYASFSDQSPAANTVTSVGTPVSDSGVQFNGENTLLLNGSNALRVNGTATSASIANSNDFSWEAWVYPTSFASISTIIGKRDTSSAEEGDLLVAQTTGFVNALAYRTGSAIVNIASDAPLVLNTWTHVAFVRENGVYNLYVQGILQTTSGVTALTPSGNGQDIYIGDNRFNSSRRFVGNIGPCRITNNEAVYTGSTFTVDSEFSIT